MRFIGGLTFIFFAWNGSALAYIDPGSGSAIMSAIIGFFVAAGMLIKTYWYKFKGMITFDSTKSGEGAGRIDDDDTTSGDSSPK